MRKKKAYIRVQGAELGWFGNTGGRIAEFEFRGENGRRIGTLQVSSARIRWRSAGETKWHWLSVKRLPKLFAKTRTLTK